MRACVRVCVGGARARRCVYVRVCVCYFGGADGCIPVTMLVDVCRCPPFAYVCLPLSRHFPCCKTW